MSEREPKKKRKKKSLARSFVVTVAIGIPGALLANTGCGSSQNPENGAGGRAPGLQPGVENGICNDEGAQRPCHMSLPATNGGPIQSCFYGTQTCTGGLWSGCGGDGTVTNSVRGDGLHLAPSSAQPGQTGIHTLAGGCGDGVCSGPVCKGGANNGRLCSIAGCSGGVCLVNACDRGTNRGNLCALPADCPGGACVPQGESCSTCATDCGVCAPGVPSSGASICTSDPCNPDCQGWTTPAGLSSGGGTGVSVIGVSGFGQIANGQISKLLLDNAHTGKACDDFVSPGLPSSYYNCQVDTSCSMSALGGDGNCHQFPAGGIQGTDLTHMGVNPGIDLTIGPGCSDIEADKYRYFPICNRGTLPVAAGTVIKVRYMNPTTPFDPCPIGPTYDCSLTTDAVLGLPPGVCQLLDTQCPNCAPSGTACSQPSGDKWMYINSDGAVPEGTMTMKPGAAPTGVTGAPDNEPTTAPGILGCANNWSDHSPNNNPPACSVDGQNVVSFTSDYHATCPTGSGVVWSKLIYDTTLDRNTSGTSEVFFEAATAPDVGGVPGPFSLFYEMAEAQDNNNGVPYVIAGATLGADPEVCTFTRPYAQVPLYTWNTCTNATPSNPNCCPKDIQQQFQRSVTETPFEGAGPAAGALLAKNDWLRLKITIKSTPDNRKDAILNNWSLSYTCVDRE